MGNCAVSVYLPLCGESCYLSLCGSTNWIDLNLRLIGGKLWWAIDYFPWSNEIKADSSSTRGRSLCFRHFVPRVNHWLNEKLCYIKMWMIPTYTVCFIKIYSTIKMYNNIYNIYNKYFVFNHQLTFICISNQHQQFAGNSMSSTCHFPLAGLW